MDSKQGNRRRVCRKSNSIDPPSPVPLRTPKTMLDTPHRMHLLVDVRHTAGKLSRTELFKIYNVVRRTGFRILKEGTVRYNEKVCNQGRKKILVLYKYEVVEAIKDANFDFVSLSHFKIIKTINITNDSKRII